MLTAWIGAGVPVVHALSLACSFRAFPLELSFKCERTVLPLRRSG